MKLTHAEEAPAATATAPRFRHGAPAVTTLRRHGLPDLDDLLPRNTFEAWMFSRADEAAQEARDRMANERLCAQVAAYLGPQVLPLTWAEPTFILVRAVESADTEMVRFTQLCRAVGARPVVLTMHGDRFINFNPDKFRRAKPTFWSSRPETSLRVGDLRGADGTAMDQLRTRHGGSLVDFHGRLFEQFHGDVPRWDRTEWLRPEGHSDYLRFFAFAMVGAVLVEARDSDPLEVPFWRDRVEPGFLRAEQMFGVRPLMTCHYAAHELDDDYWWGHPMETLPAAKAILGDPRG